MEGAAIFVFILFMFALPHLFGAIKESGVVKPPKFGRKSTSFRLPDEEE